MSAEHVVDRIWAVKDDVPALEALLATLEHPRHREILATVLDSAPSPDNVAVLGRMATEDPAISVRTHAAAFLSRQVVPEARPFITRCLLSETSLLQLRGLQFVARDPDPQFRVDVERCLRHPNRRMRRRAARALGRIGHPDSADRLKAALRDRDPLTRWLAWRALAKLA